MANRSSHESNRPPEAEGSAEGDTAYEGFGNKIGLKISAGETAIQAAGSLRFDRASGLATIPVGSNNVVVTPPMIDITQDSKILATLQGS